MDDLIWDKPWAIGMERQQKNHARFLSHLDKSTTAVWCVAQWLCNRGYQATVLPATKAANPSEWKDHADVGDILLSQRIEVKRLSVEFSGREDWPFGEDFIVCAKHAWDRAKPKPHAFIILSANMGHAAIVKGDTFGRWRVEKRKDSRYNGIEQEFYLCPLDDIEWRIIN